MLFSLVQVFDGFMASQSFTASCGALYFLTLFYHTIFQLFVLQVFFCRIGPERPDFTIPVPH